PGRLPTLWECHTSKDLLAELMAELSGGIPSELSHLAGALWEQHAGNVRKALRDCYDMLAQGHWPEAVGFRSDTRRLAAIVHS
ncbi:MAG TPA: hypothetical protein VKY92_09690, partial [Verrucomicrobiae bacterium]|nr:hypothetical protein [Verrucomicrobiae bacterium]